MAQTATRIPKNRRQILFKKNEVQLKENRKQKPKKCPFTATIKGGRGSKYVGS